MPSSPGRMRLRRAISRRSLRTFLNTPRGRSGRVRTGQSGRRISMCSLIGSSPSARRGLRWSAGAHPSSFRSLAERDQVAPGRACRRCSLGRAPSRAFRCISRWLKSRDRCICIKSLDHDEAAGRWNGRELAEAPAAVQAPGAGACRAARRARGAARAPIADVVVTCARGSSAHAATFAKHLIERYLGIPVAAAAPNIATIYHRRLALKDQLFLAISQSGSSDDLIEAAAAARAADALTAASSTIRIVRWRRLANSSCRWRRDRTERRGDQNLHRLARRFAASDREWTGNEDIGAACDRLPDRLSAARLDWSEALAPLTSRRQPGHNRPRSDARHRARGGAETERNLHAARRGFQQRRIPSWTDRSRLAHATRSCAHADRRSRPWVFPISSPICAARALRACRRGRRAHNRRGCRRWRPISADADAICLIQSFYAFPGSASRSGAAPMSISPVICKK